MFLLMFVCPWGYPRMHLVGGVCVDGCVDRGCTGTQPETATEAGGTHPNAMLTCLDDIIMMYLFNNRT